MIASRPDATGSTCTRSPLRQHPRRVCLDTEVQRGDTEAYRADGGDDVSRRRTDLCRQVRPGHRRETAVTRASNSSSAASAAPENTPARIEPCSRRTRVIARDVDAGDADDALLYELIVEAAGGAPVRDASRGLRTANPATQIRPGSGASPPLQAAFAVLVVPPGVPDLRRGRNQDLAVVAGVGE